MQRGSYVPNSPVVPRQELEILTCWFSDVCYNFDCYLWRGVATGDTSSVERWGNFENGESRGLRMWKVIKIC